jgi:hypothetical protein
VNTRKAVVGLLLLAAAGSASAVRQLSDAEFDRVWDRFDRERMESSAAAEREGDASVSRGHHAEAYEKYVDALRG